MMFSIRRIKHLIIAHFSLFYCGQSHVGKEKVGPENASQLARRYPQYLQSLPQAIQQEIAELFQLILLKIPSSSEQTFTEQMFNFGSKQLNYFKTINEQKITIYRSWQNHPLQTTIDNFYSEAQKDEWCQSINHFTISFFSYSFEVNNYTYRLSTNNCDNIFITRTPRSPISLALKKITNFIQNAQHYQTLASQEDAALKKAQ